MRYARLKLFVEILNESDLTLREQVSYYPRNQLSNDLWNSIQFTVKNRVQYLIIAEVKEKVEQSQWTSK